MKFFWLYFILSILPPRLYSQSVQAVNSSFPFRVGINSLTKGNQIALTFSSLNNYKILFLAPFLTLPTLGIGFNSIDYQVTVSLAPVSIKITISDFTISGFTLQSTIFNFNFYKKVCYTFIASNPDWSIWKFYLQSYSSSGNFTQHNINAANIGGQPLENLKAVMLRGIDMNYTYPYFPYDDPPYQFFIQITSLGIASHKNMVKGVINKLNYDLTLITYNGTLGMDYYNQQYGLKWGMAIFSIQESEYGMTKTKMLLPGQCVRFTNYGMYGISWFNRTHLSFSFEPDNTNNINWKWSARSLTYYLNLTKFYFTVEKCTSATYIYLDYQKQRCYSSCPSGYYENEGKMTCQPCTTPINCSKCATQNTCQICNTQSNIYLNIITGLCFYCTLQNCIKCSSQMICQQCVSSDQIILYLGQCKICNTKNCSKCLTPTTCQICESSFDIFLYDGLCEKCNLTGCIKCSTPTICQICNSVQKQNIFLYFGQCLVCNIPNCSTCITPTICQSQTIIDQHLVPNKSIEILEKYSLNQIQKQFLKTVQLITSGLSQKSAIIFSSVSLTSFTGYFINILWTMQICSFYAFLNVSKPLMLDLFLDTTIILQKVDILPLQFPDLFENDQLFIQRNQIFQRHNTDLYFMRRNYQSLIEVTVFVFLYFILFSIFKFIPWKNCLFKYLKRRTISNVYMNISMVFYGILVEFTFSASASLTSNKFQLRNQILNYLYANIGLFISLLFIITNTVILYVYHNKPNIDNQQCYLGYNQKRKGAQFQLFVYMISQIITPILILFTSPMFSLSSLIIIQVVNICKMFKNPMTNLKIITYLRILQGMSYIIINTLFIVFEIIKTHFSNTSITSLNIAGYFIIVSFVLTFVIQVAQILIQVCVDICKKLKKLCSKTQQKQLHQSNITIQNSNFQSKKRRVAIRNKNQQIKQIQKRQKKPKQFGIQNKLDNNFQFEVSEKLQFKRYKKRILLQNQKTKNNKILKYRN